MAVPVGRAHRLNEEKVVFAELGGCPEYAARVRYRFVPGVW